MKQLKIGLSSEQLEQLREVFARHTLIEEVLVYGSRAKGNYHERSDLDLALKGRLDRHLLAAIKLDLEETDLPLGFDVLDYQEINNALLKDHIDRVGVVIYSQ
ncbi:Nucleotidyltransferase domain-containing protein [Marinospirillum celere]|uniref:Nucleotidyltransferase domain-containing protein n=1 Tax=Marinospirillum celere TaxID=1122252 RepID=A0A1I1E9U3_9GAMM|nr:nucleotidyltransferase domain-containing protein [Marinospirillum celere]SFB83871.1 Nucleotidyltransferase domain-containing protein [Marinospirillum celere]